MGLENMINHNIQGLQLFPTISASCVFGIASGKASTLRRLCVACSYANANDTSSNSLNAVPMNAIPKGMFGPLSRIGSAGASVVFGGKNPSGTIEAGSEYCLIVQCR